MRSGAMLRSLFLLSCCAVLTACGGGGGSPTTPTPPAAGAGATNPAGVATIFGTVTGFGSVIIDGTRVQSHGTLPSVRKEDGSAAPVELKLGHVVRASHDGNLVARSIEVLPVARGPVDKVNAAAGTLTMLGQVIAINTDPKAGPVTVFEAPYTKLADIKVGDVIQVHGLVRIDSAGRSTLQATRIEQKPAESLHRASGIVSELSASAKTFRIGSLVVDYASATLAPAGATIENGTEVRVSFPGGLPAAGTAVKATVVIVTEHGKEEGNRESVAGGAVSAVDAMAKTLTVGGVRIDASTAAFPQAGKSLADVKVGTYVVVKGVYTGTAAMKASSIILRGADGDSEGHVELHGTILDFASNANFMLRDVRVNASAANINLAACGGGTQLANGMQVEVKGTLAATGEVKATLVKCVPAKDGDTTVARNGTAGKVDVAAKTFVLTGDKGTTLVQWNDKTLFVRAEAASLDGKKLVVEGTMSKNVLQASKIVLAER